MALTTKLGIKVVPGAARTELSGWLGDVLKVRIAAPAEQGRANRALVQLLANTLDVHRRQVRICSGSGAQRKVVEIDGLTRDEIHARLNRA